MCVDPNRWDEGERGGQVGHANGDDWTERETERERERERGSLPFRAKGSRRGTHPRLFFAPKHPNFTVILGRREWRVYKKEQVSATCWAVNDDKTPSPPHANSIVSVCLSLSLSLSLSLQLRGKPLLSLTVTSSALFFSFLFFLFSLFGFEIGMEGTNGKWWPGYESFSSSNSWQFSNPHYTIFHYSVHSFVIFPIPIIYKSLGNYTQHFLDLN